MKIKRKSMATRNCGPRHEVVASELPALPGKSTTGVLKNGCLLAQPIRRIRKKIGAGGTGNSAVPQKKLKQESSISKEVSLVGRPCRESLSQCLFPSPRIHKILRPSTKTPCANPLLPFTFPFPFFPFLFFRLPPAAAIIVTLAGT